MTSYPKNIQIFLPSGDPQGIRLAEITTRILQVIEVPRSALSEFLKMPESEQVAVYFLVGESGDGAESSVYIGQTGDLRNRLPTHNKEKDFWERALILISKTNSLTQTHALFLEWQCLKATREAGRFADENGNSGSKPHTPAPLEADCVEIFETGRVLLSTLGYPIFAPVAAPSDDGNESETFYFCKGSGADARGLYTAEGFVVLKGSTGRKGNVTSIEGTSDARFRARLVEAGVMQEQGDKIVFTKDHLFRSPSMAAVALQGRTANGWEEWKDGKGVTLNILKRQST